MSGRALSQPGSVARESATTDRLAPEAHVAPVPAKQRSNTRRLKAWISGAIVLLLVAAGYYAWQQLKPAGLPAGIAAGNGRLEAIEIDIAAKIAGRINNILVDEGDFVSVGQVLARMDTATLDAQKREAEAQLQRATIAVQTAQRSGDAA